MEENYIMYCLRTGKSPFLKSSFRSPEDEKELEEYYRKYRIKLAVQALKLMHATAEEILASR